MFMYVLSYEYRGEHLISAIAADNDKVLMDCYGPRQTMEPFILAVAQTIHDMLNGTKSPKDIFGYDADIKLLPALSGVGWYFQAQRREDHGPDHRNDN